MTEEWTGSAPAVFDFRTGKALISIPDANSAAWVPDFY